MGEIPEPPEMPEGYRPAVIIGHGRMGEAIRQMGLGRDTVVKRGDPFPTDAPAGPIYVCTGNGALEDVIAMTPEERWEDFVFVQSGALLPLLERKFRPGLPITVLLAYFVVAERGQLPIDAVTDMDVGGLSALNHTGKWSREVRWRLRTSSLRVSILFEPSFTQAYCERNLWTAAYMLVGSLHEGCTVGEVEAQHQKEVDELVCELATTVTAFYPDVRWDRGLTCERLASYARSVAHLPTSLDEFTWHNGAFHELSMIAQASGRLDPCPSHTDGLQKLGAVPPDASAAASAAEGARSARGNYDVKSFLLDL